MMNRTRISWLNIVYRNMSTSRRDVTKKNHYDSLEIKSKATHNEIKSAYFKLSKQYHPDMNSSEEAKVKFNDISDAYEILGNHEKRKQYDRGLQITPMTYDRPDIMRPTDITDITEEAKRAHSEICRNRTQPDGSPIYNFDAWNEEHYGRVFERRQQDLSHYKRHQNEQKQETKRRIAARYDSSIFVMFISIVFVLISVQIQYFENVDTPMIIFNEEKAKKDDFIVEKR